MVPQVVRHLGDLFICGRLLSDVPGSGVVSGGEKSEARPSERTCAAEGSIVSLQA